MAAVIVGPVWLVLGLAVLGAIGFGIEKFINRNRFKDK